MNTPDLIDALNTRNALPGTAVVTTGEAGLPMVRITTLQANADIYLHGGQITSWRPAGHEEVLFLSRHSRWEQGRAIRGGIPICFPWFRSKADNPKAPAHGFARTRPWDLSIIAQEEEAVAVTFNLESDESTRHWWPYSFSAMLRITVGARLTVTLFVDNLGTEPFTFEEALHTYFRVGDVRQAHIEGFGRAFYLDNTDGNREKSGGDLVSLSGPTDSAYLSTEAPITIVDPVLRRRLRTEKVGSRSTVVWNPWEQAAAQLSDLGDDEWPSMLCVEAANMLSNAVTLAPGEQHTMSATITVDNL